MAFGNFKLLAKGQAHLTASIVYTGTNAQTTEVGMIWLHNCGNSAQATRIYIGTTSGSENLMFNESIVMNATYEVSPKMPFVLQGTSSVWLQAANSASVNYSVFGREQV